MAINFLNIPGVQAPTGQSFAPLERAVGDYRRSIDAEHERNQNRLLGGIAASDGKRAASAEAFKQGRLQEADYFERGADADEDRKSKLRTQLIAKSAGLAQQVLEAPEQYRSAMWDKIRALDPESDKELSALGVDPRDYRAGAQFIIAQARGYQDPLDRELKQAQIDKLRRERNPASDFDQRAVAAQRYGLDPNSPQGREFILTGKMPENGGIKVPANYQADPKNPGAVMPISGGPADPAVSPPEYASRAANFVSRMVDAERNLRGITEQHDAKGKPVFDPTGGSIYAENKLRDNLGEDTVNMFYTDENNQRYRQAAEQWIRAFLRKESGAAIGADEFARDFKVYFPQPGDAPSVVRQKEAARLAAAQGFTAETRGYFPNAFPAQNQQIQRFEQAAPLRARGLSPDQAPSLLPRVQQQNGTPSRQPSASRVPPPVRLTPQQHPQVAQEAKEALDRGADPNVVRQRLLENGVDPGIIGLGGQ